MKLHFYCKHCEKRTAFRERGILIRTDLRARFGESMSKECLNCHTINKVPITRIFAKDNPLAMILSVIIGSIIIIGMMIESKSGWSVVGSTFVGACIISAGFFTRNDASVHAFNSS